MSLPTEVPLRCSCGHSFTFTFWGSVNTRDEDLKQSFLNGTLNVYKCPKCHESSFVPHPLLYHDMERKLQIWVYDPKQSKDPRREIKPAMASAITGLLGEEILAADDFDCARVAIAQLENSEAFAQLRAAHRDWPDSKVYARMFEQSFQAAKERLNEPLVPSPQPDTGITDEDLDALARQIAERALAKHVAKRDSTSSDADAGTTDEEPALEEVDALLAEWDEGDPNETGDSEPTPPGRVIEHRPDASLFDIIDDHERRIIVDMLEQTHWNQTEAAERFGIPLSMLQQKIMGLNIEVPHLPGEPTLREAFWDSARQDAPAPALWWLFPVGGMILGVVLVAWSPLVGIVVASLSATFFFGGIYRAERNRPTPNQQKGANMSTMIDMGDPYRLASGGLLLVLGLAAAWVALSTSMWIGFRLVAGIFALLWILAALRAFWRAAQLPF